eukprot:9493655-Pyramimonas_sp.AAC.1
MTARAPSIRAGGLDATTTELGALEGRTPRHQHATHEGTRSQHALGNRQRMRAYDGQRRYPTKWDCGWRKAETDNGGTDRGSS